MNDNLLPKITNSKGFFTSSLLLLIIGILLGAGFMYLQPEKSVPASKLPIKTVTLPTDAVKISECIPFEGEHYVRIDDIPNGPYYVVYNGEVMSIEYMFEPDKIPGREFAHLQGPQEVVQYMQENQLTLADIVEMNSDHKDLMDLAFKDFTLNWTPPHAGMPVPHYDIHFHLADEAKRNTVCPDATLEEQFNPVLMEQLQNLGIPLPGMPPQ